LERGVMIFVIVFVTVTAMIPLKALLSPWNAQRPCTVDEIFSGACGFAVNPPSWARVFPDLDHTTYLHQRRHVRIRQIELHGLQRRQSTIDRKW
jgi:hypothetical protein